MGDRIHAVVDFTHADIDIDAEALPGGPDGQGTDGDPVASARRPRPTPRRSTTPPTMPGTYFLRVYPFRDEDKPSGAYSITID